MTSIISIENDKRNELEIENSSLRLDVNSTSSEIDPSSIRNQKDSGGSSSISSNNSNNISSSNINNINRSDNNISSSDSNNINSSNSNNISSNNSNIINTINENNAISLCSVTASSHNNIPRPPGLTPIVAVIPTVGLTPIIAVIPTVGMIHA